MSSRRSRRVRVMPYDLNNPANWTGTKLRAELANLGMTITAKSVPVIALRQMYDQLLTMKNQNITRDSLQDTSDGQTANREPEIAMVDTETIDPLHGLMPNLTTSVMDQRESAEVSRVESTSAVMPTAERELAIVPAIMPTNSTDSNSSLLLQSTMGMVSSMQNTIATLQSTINTLLQKQVPETPTNMLGKFYKEKTSTSFPQVDSNKEHGVAADDLPHIDFMTDTLRRNITNGKYINLASLLIPEYEIPISSLTELSGIELLRKSNRDHRLDRVLSITQFYKAFGIYKRVMCEAYPQRRTELDQYEADIGNIFEHYGDMFYQYHVQFTKQAAAYMEKGIKLDWSKRNKDLFQLLIGGVRTKLCEHCSQTDHQSAFCPSQINVQVAANAKRGSENNRGTFKQDSSQDRFGRSRVTFKGKEICNNFNGPTGCRREGTCSFAHVCKKCKGIGHGEITCVPHTKPTPVSQSSSPAEKIKNKSPN